MQSRRLHRLSRFRRNKRRLRDRLRQRIFFREDRMKPEAMAKPRVVVLTGAGISAESGIKTFRAAVFYVLVTALLLSLLASWYPARRASRIDPARVLSGQ
ncbi:NAD-dependent deacetylase [Klebsiella pneumoniae]|nr:NAD-dependent deacetylase [Klebsiella pneumoniae]